MDKKEFEFKKTILDSGIVLLTTTIPYVYSVSIGFLVKAGSDIETHQEKGIAHFVEHMVFKGSKKYSSSAIARNIENFGGVINASTGNDYTFFYIKIRNNHVNLALKILLDMIFNPLFAEKDFQKEKKVILEELDNIIESPDELLQELILEKILYNGNKNFSIFAERRNVEKLTLDKLKKFYNKYYSSSNLIISVAGDISHEKTVKLLKKELANYNTNKAIVKNQNIQIGNFENKSVCYTHIKPEISQANVVLARKGITYSNKDRFAWAVLNSYIGSGMSSVLYNKVREKLGLVYTIYSFLDAFLNNGIWGIYFNSNIVNAKKIIGLIRELLIEVKEKSISKNKLAILKEKIKGNLIINMESTSVLMRRQAILEFYFGKYYPIETVFDYIDKVSQHDIRRVANDMLDISKLSLIAVAKKNLC